MTRRGAGADDTAGSGRGPAVPMCMFSLAVHDAKCNLTLSQRELPRVTEANNGTHGIHTADAVDEATHLEFTDQIALTLD